MNSHAGHAIVVAYDEAAQRVAVLHDGVADLALVAFDVRGDSRAIELLQGRIGRGRAAVLEPIVGNGQKGTTKRIKVSDRGYVGVGSGFLSSNPLWIVHRQVKWMLCLDSDLDHLRAALHWSLATQLEIALELSSRLRGYWGMRGHFVEGRHWLEQALNATEGGEQAQL